MRPIWSQFLGRCRSHMSTYTFLILLQYVVAFTIPFLSTPHPSSLASEAYWLSTPSEVLYRDFHPKASSPSSDQNSKQERVLLLTPLKDAASHLRHHFALLHNLTYPHHLIDLGFIIGDSTDNTRSLLDAELDKIESGPRDEAFNSATIVLKDLGNARSEEVSKRHGFGAQVERRKKLAIVRNTLLQKALKPEHEWVFWRDVDVAESPASILEEFISHGKDVLVPNIWFRRTSKGSTIEGGYDYNSWQETPQSEAWKEKLDTEVILAEGYSQFKTHRLHMAQLGDWRNNAGYTIPLDGVGGVSLLIRAELHRKGIDFPIKPVDHQIETEGLAKLAKIAGYGVYGLPNYIVWHFDTAEKEGNLHETPAWLWPALYLLALLGVVLGWRWTRGSIRRRLRWGGAEKIRRV